MSLRQFGVTTSLVGDLMLIPDSLQVSWQLASSIDELQVELLIGLTHFLHYFPEPLPIVLSDAIVHIRVEL